MFLVCTEICRWKLHHLESQCMGSTALLVSSANSRYSQEDLWCRLWLLQTCTSRGLSSQSQTGIGYGSQHFPSLEGWEGGCFFVTCGFLRLETIWSAIGKALWGHECAEDTARNKAQGQLRPHRDGLTYKIRDWDPALIHEEWARSTVPFLTAPRWTEQE